jgi:DNA primase catalytic subunit
MSAAREKDQADFDLERFVDMFDEAMTSQDPRVMDSLRSLMMIVTLTRPELKTEHSRNHGPLRRLFEDINHLNRRIYNLEDKISDMSRPDRSAEKYAYTQYPNEKYVMTASQAMAAQIDQDVLNRAQGLK